MNLREMIKRDFGYDLPISGGSGLSPADPIHVNVKDKRKASAIQSIYCRCVYGANSWYWRHLTSEWVLGDFSSIAKISSQVKYLERNQIVTETRNFYWDMSEVDISDNDTIYNPLVGIEPPVGIYIPYELGWFHYDSHINDEDTNPGMGVSVAYSAPNAKLTLFMYDNSIKDFIMSDRLGATRKEFAQAVSDFESYNTSPVLLNSYDDEYYLSNIYDENGAMTVVSLGVFNGLFNKIRLTTGKEKEEHALHCALDTIGSITSIFRDYPKQG